MTPLLQKNLVALNAVNPTLCERICWATESTLTRVQDGTLVYRIHRRWHILEPEPGEVSRLLGELEPSRPTLLFGVGGGRLLEELLRLPGPDPVVAWERDPWLLRLTLERVDCEAALASGRLRLGLGMDLLDELPLGERFSLLQHPVLGPCYQRELEFFRQGPHPRVALLRSGGLFVDDLARALTSAGYALYTVDTEGLCAEELRLVVRRSGAEVLAAINYQHFLAEFCQAEGITLICWEIDPSLEIPQPPVGATDRTFLFSYRQVNAALYQEAGFEHVEYLPLAADIDRRRPEQIPDELRQRYSEPVTFVGASMVEDARIYLSQFVQLYLEYAGSGDALEECQRRLELIVAGQREDFSRYLVGDLLRQHFAAFVEHMAAHRPYLDLEMMVAQASASDKRITYVSALADAGIKVWGDAGWELAERAGVRYAGRMAHHHDELSRIYQCSTINLDVGRVYQSDMVTMRVFDTLACGGFLLTEHNDALAELLEPGIEVATYRTLEELREKTRHYLDHPDEAREMARRGREAVVARHQMRRRLEHIFRCAGLPGPGPR